MPTVAACGLHFDARASSPHAFLLDAGELCSNAFMAGLSDLTVTSGQFKSQADFRMGVAASDSLLLGGLHYSDDELSPGSSHVNGAAAMQFLLLDDDEVAGTGLEDPAKPALDGCFAATSAGLGVSDGAMLRQQSGHSCEAATRSSVPVVDSSALYCLAVVDELTGLPLRPATPEETWEVERCFVLQQQSELIEAGMLPELQHHQPLEQQLQEGQLAASRAGSADVSAVGDEGLHHQHLHQQAVSQGPSHTLDPEEEQEEEEQPKAESSKRSKEAAARAAGPPQRRPDQPRRCGPCDNCGATESPQWRQGPPAKPLLCNACGMRFRRTNQLVAGETGASGVRGGARAHKKSVAPPADVEADLEVARPSKASKAVAPPLVAPDAKRPRRAAAVAAAATFAAAAIDVM